MFFVCLFLCLLQVVVGPDLVLPPGVKITLKKPMEDDSDFGMDELSLEEKPSPQQGEGHFFPIFFRVVVIIYFSIGSKKRPQEILVFVLVNGEILVFGP